MRSQHPRRRTRGFGIVEMLVAVGLAAIVMVSATRFFSYQVRAMRVERVRRGAQMTARTALNFMARQMELLGRDPSRTLFASLDNGMLPPAIAAADDSSIHYRTNLSEDLADVDALDEWEDVTFSVDDGVLWVQRGTTTPLALTDDSAVQSSHVADDGLTFEYFDGTGDPIVNLTSNAARASVRRIRVTLTVMGGATGDTSGPSVTLSQDVFLRNAS